MEDSAWDQLASFVRREACISPEKSVFPEMSVELDLGQEGDEADDFMHKFFDTFDLDRGDYDFHRYFLMEGEGLLYHFLKKYVLGKAHSLKRDPLTVGMLHKAIISGRWNSEELSSN